MNEFIFDGFEPANTVPVPDVLFDELLSVLSGAEIKVMLYIIRRTLGFKKSTDAISLTQFEKGIVTKDNHVLDKGCGLSRETICKALDSLEKRGCIKSQKSSNSKNEKAINVYSIRFKGDQTVVGKSDYPLVGKSDYVVKQSDQGSQKSPTRVVGKSDIQETVLQDTDLQETVSEIVPTSETPAHEDTHTSFPNSSSSKHVAETAATTPQARSSAETAMSAPAPRTPGDSPPVFSPGVRGVSLPQDENRVGSPPAQDKAQVNSSKKPGWKALLDYWDSKYGPGSRPKWVEDEAKDMVERMKPTPEQVDKVCAELKARNKPVTFENMYNNWHLLKEIEGREQQAKTHPGTKSVSGRRRFDETDPAYAEYMAMMKGGK